MYFRDESKSLLNPFKTTLKQIEEQFVKPVPTIYLKKKKTNQLQKPLNYCQHNTKSEIINKICC